MSAGAVLGFDTATAWVAIAITQGEELVWEEEHGPGGDGRPRHGELLLASVKRCVEQAGGWGTVGTIAVGLGPGSFTGLRIGIASARALAQARELPIAGVPSLATLAAGVSEHPDAAGRLAIPVIDARRGQVFAAFYESDGEERLEPAVFSPEDLAKAIAELDRPHLIAGDGSLRFRQELEAAGGSVAGARDPVHRVAARHVCALAAASESLVLERIEPIYLREPDAKRWRQRDRGESAG